MPVSLLAGTVENVKCPHKRYKAYPSQPPVLLHSKAKPPALCRGLLLSAVVLLG